MKQKIKLVAIGTAVNYGLFLICSQLLTLPVWFDTTGTALIAIFGGFMPAACVGVLSTVLLIPHFGLNTVPFVVVHFAQAAVFSLLARQITNFDGLLVVLSTGKVDMAGGSISMTEERQQQVDFVGPYYEGGVTLVTRKERLQS